MGRIFHGFGRHNTPPSEEELFGRERIGFPKGGSEVSAITEAPINDTGEPQTQMVPDASAAQVKPGTDQLNPRPPRTGSTDEFDAQVKSVIDLKRSLIGRRRRHSGSDSDTRPPRAA